MKKNVLRRNIGVLLMVFIVMFVTLIGYLAYSVSTYGERWFATAHNPRIQNLKTTIDVGDILDRSGQVLVQTDSDGNREYGDDIDMRTAVAHIVGDEYGYSYGAQTVYARYLYGLDKDTATRIEDLLSGNERKGSDVMLTIDAALCETAMDALSGSRGAVVVMNYQTGEILASVSAPSFDPADMSAFAEGGGDSELVNRAFSGLYPPGSTFKLITAAALIAHGKEGFETTCDGSTEIDGKEIVCTGEHGRVDLESAIEHSCNVYFAEAAGELGAYAIQQEAEKFLFNKKTLFDDVVMGNSVFEAATNDVDAAWAAIGQYHDLVTPLHACMIAGSIGNDGVMMEPKLLRSILNGNDETMMLKPAVAATPMKDTSQLKEMMISVVESGTGTAAQIDGVTVAGKTGTAEVDTDGEQSGEHAWFVGFIDDGEHPLAIAVIMEMAGSGGKNAAPAARKVLERALDLGY